MVERRQDSTILAQQHHLGQRGLHFLRMSQGHSLSSPGWYQDAADSRARVLVGLCTRNVILLHRFTFSKVSCCFHPCNNCALQTRAQPTPPWFALVLCVEYHQSKLP